MYLKEFRVQKVQQTAETQSLILQEMRFGNMIIQKIKMGNNYNGKVLNPMFRNILILFAAIRTGKPINEAENTAISTWINHGNV